MERVKPYVTEEQVRAAKEVNTLAFLLRHQPERFKRVGRTEYAHCGHDSLKVSVNGKWNWHSRGVGGTTAVQYLIKVEGYEFVRAVQIVCADAPFLSSPPVTEEKNSGFALPPRGDNFKAYQYLAGRGVCDEVLAFCFHTGRVYGRTRRTAERERSAHLSRQARIGSFSRPDAKSARTPGPVGANAESGRRFSAVTVARILRIAGVPAAPSPPPHRPSHSKHPSGR